MTRLESQSEADIPDASPLTGWRRWLHEHDDRWLFIILYVTLAVTLSIWISLFWLVAVVAVHGLIEWLRYRQQQYSGRQIVIALLWELKLDIGLIILSAAIAVYMDLIMGIAGLGGAARLGLHSGARASAWVRALRGLLLSVDDAAQVARVALNRRNGNHADGNGDGHAATDEPPPTIADVIPQPYNNPFMQPWNFGDKLAIALCVIFTLMLLLAPVATDHSLGGMMAILTVEFHPWP